MLGDPSLARLIRDYSDRWEIEHIERGAEWIACQADPDGFIRVIAARDLHALRYKIRQAEQHDDADQDPS